MHTLHNVVLIRKRRYKFIAPLELATWCVRYRATYSAVWISYKKFQFQCHVYVHFHVRVCVNVRVCARVLVDVLVYVLVRVLVRVNINYGGMNIYVRHGSYVVSSQGSYEVACKLKGPPT
jgi:hypothetical protein